MRKIKKLSNKSKYVISFLVLFTIAFAVFGAKIIPTIISRAMEKSDVTVYEIHSSEKNYLVNGQVYSLTLKFNSDITDMQIQGMDGCNNISCQKYQDDPRTWEIKITGINKNNAFVNGERISFSLVVTDSNNKQGELEITDNSLPIYYDQTEQTVVSNVTILNQFNYNDINGKYTDDQHHLEIEFYSTKPQLYFAGNEIECDYSSMSFTAWYKYKLEYYIPSETTEGVLDNLVLTGADGSTVTNLLLSNENIVYDVSEPSVTISSADLLNLENSYYKYPKIKLTVADGCGLNLDECGGDVLYKGEDIGNITITKDESQEDVYWAEASIKDNKHLADIVILQIKLVDNLGHTFISEDTQPTEGSELIYIKSLVDTINPTVEIDSSSYEITSSVVDSKECKVITFEVSASDADSGVVNFNYSDYFYVDFDNDDITSTVNRLESGNYKFTVYVPEGSSINGKGKVVIYDNAAGCTIVETKKLVIDFKDPELKEINFEKIINDDNMYDDVLSVKKQDKVKCTFKISDDNEFANPTNKVIAIDINGKDGVVTYYPQYKWRNNGDYVYEFEMTMDENAFFTDQDNISINEIRITDDSSNVKTISGTNQLISNIVYMGDLKTSDFTISKTDENSQPTDSKFVKAGDQIYITFNTSHRATGVNLTIGDNTVAASSSEDGKKWHVYYDIPENEFTDNTYIDFSVQTNDNAGNYSNIVTEDSLNEKDEDGNIISTKNLTYYSNIIYNFSTEVVGSGNNDYVKNGDKIKINVDVEHAVTTAKVVINGQQYDLVKDETDECKYSYEYQVSEGTYYDNQRFDISFYFVDDAFNVSDNIEKKTYTYFAPISVTNLQLTSNNGNNSLLCKNGDELTATFSTTHPVIISNGKIAGRSVNFVNTDGNGLNWSAKLSVDNGLISDEGLVDITLDISDAANNSSISLNAGNLISQRVMYYAPISVTNIVAHSSNPNNGNMYAKDNDSVNVSFIANHTVNVSSQTIAGNGADVTSARDNENYQYNLTSSIKNGSVSDLSTVPFTFTLTDVAGNMAVSRSNNDSSNNLTYYAPITATTSIASNNTRNNYAKNGDAITLNVAASHSASVDSATILGRAASANTSNAKDLSITYNIAAQDAGLSEGNVGFAYTLSDVAGNKLEVNSANSGSVIYDRQNPTISVTPEFSGYSNGDLTLGFSYSDANLSGNDVVLTLNDQEQIGSGEKSSISGTNFTKELTISDEGEYNIYATAMDLAGNKSTRDAKMQVTIDKTNPEITSYNINTEVATTYKSGFIISDFFKINEDNISEIVCRITTSDGTYDWDMDTPIDQDGKITVNILVRDLAGNASSFTYDMYIDGTNPLPVIEDTVSGNKLDIDKDNYFSKDMNLSIGLEDLSMGTEDKDQYTKIEIYDENDVLISDILSTQGSGKDDYTYKVSEYGKYKVVVSAIDSVGNELSNETYNFTFTEKEVNTSSKSNTKIDTSKKTVFMVIGISCGVAVIGVASIFFFTRKKKVIK